MPSLFDQWGLVLRDTTDPENAWAIALIQHCGLFTVYCPASDLSCYIRLTAHMGYSSNLLHRIRLCAHGSGCLMVKYTNVLPGISHDSTDCAFSCCFFVQPSPFFNALSVLQERTWPCFGKCPVLSKDTHKKIHASFTGTCWAEKNVKRGAAPNSQDW